MNYEHLTYAPRTRFWRKPSFIALPIVLATLLALAPIFTAPALAQHNDRDRLAEELALTDQMLEQARDHLRQSTDAKSNQMLEQAAALQRRAHDFFEQGRYVMALSMTTKARDVIKRIVGEFVSRNEDRTLVEQQLDRTDDYLDRARQGLAGTDAPALQMFVDEAARMQDRAREYFSENNLKQALQFTRRAQELLKKASDQVGDRRRQQGQFEHYLQQTRDDAESLHEFIYNSGSDEATRLFEAGNEQIDRAQQLYEMGRVEEAIRMLAQARSKIGQAQRIIQIGNSPQGTQRAIDIAQHRHDNLQERARDNGNRDVLDLLDEAADKLQRARNLYDQGEYQRALVMVRIVMELNQQAARMLGD